MNLTNKIILITGGGSGLGLEIARLLATGGSRVIIAGRNANKLKAAAAQINSLKTMICDVTDAQSVFELFTELKKQALCLDMIINNAGYANLNYFNTGPEAYLIAAQEMSTNYLAVIRMNEKFLHQRNHASEAVIVNVGSEVVFTPSIALPTYTASKIALHSYTRLLRDTLRGSTVSVFELLPPLIDTDFSRKAPGGYRMIAAEVAQALLEGLEQNRHEIRIGYIESLANLYMES